MPRSTIASYVVDALGRVTSPFAKVRISFLVIVFVFEVVPMCCSFFLVDQAMSCLYVAICVIVDFLPLGFSFCKTRRSWPN